MLLMFIASMNCYCTKHGRLSMLIQLIKSMVYGKCFCSLYLAKAVIENCSKWAKDGKEKEIINAAFVVGQAKAVPMPDQV